MRRGAVAPPSSPHRPRHSCPPRRRGREAPHMRAYLPPRASSSSCVPSSATVPPSMSAMASAPRMTGRVCAIMTTVRREDSKLAIALRQGPD